MKTLDSLNRAVIRCRRCSRLVEHRESVCHKPPRRFQNDTSYWGRPVPSFGDPRARVLIVGLAPAAHGANRTGRMFTGDRSGDWLVVALYRFGFANQPESLARSDGLELRDCYITAAARCAPPGNKPTHEEFDSCRGFLVREIQLMRQVRVVIALGKIAFDQYLAACKALGLAVPSPRPAFGHAARVALPWTTLLASYHPSQQNTFTGKLTVPMFHGVFEAARAELDATT